MKIKEVLLLLLLGLCLLVLLWSPCPAWTLLVAAVRLLGGQILQQGLVVVNDAFRRDHRQH
jgi:hypothetical protein